MALTGSEDAELDFAYKYPFSQEAKRIVSGMSRGFDSKALGDGKRRAQDAIDGRFEFRQIQLSGIRLTHLVSYVYARMVVSSLKSASAINAYATAESRRSAMALREADDKEAERLSAELGMHIRKTDKAFEMPFEEYVSGMPRPERFSLSRQTLSRGRVYLGRELLMGFIENAIRKEVLKGLPIPAKELPKEVAEQARTVKLPVVKSEVAAGKDTIARYRWIEKLLANPLPDVRHRSVNLILAPYLVNIKGLGVDDAEKVIIDFIERCKALNPDTKVNSTYIRYQCRYAKEKGMRPLSLEKARGLIGMHVEI